jgi:glycine/D-amino acid oxidase-like deaminating enzyme
MSASTRHPDVIVVGAGVIGAACAAALARDGLQVVLIDADFAGGGSTGVAMGHIVVLDDSKPQLTLTAYSRALWSELGPALSPDCEDERRGTLWIAATEGELAIARAKAAVFREHGIETTLLDERELAAREPYLRRGFAGALFVPDDRVLYPPAATRHLVRRAQALGATLREGCSVEAITSSGVTLRDRNGQTSSISSAAVVNAAGIDAPTLTPGLPIVPRKGHLVITDRYPGLCRSQLVELGYLDSAHSSSGASTAFNAQPRATGQVLIGSSRELVGRDRTINNQLLRTMVRRAVGFLPDLVDCSILRVWTGFRPATPDNLPLIGRWEPVEGLWIAAGHEGLGVTTALGTAEIITAAILQRDAPISSAPYSPMRVMPAIAPAMH